MALSKEYDIKTVDTVTNDFENLLTTSDIYSSAMPLNTDPIFDADISVEEAQLPLSKLKDGKAPFVYDCESKEMMVIIKIMLTNLCL